MKYYCLSASTDNIGDEVQIIAARRNYPRVDAYVDRDRVARELRKLPPGKIVLNGWYMHPKFLVSVSWPPPEHVQALCISMHIAKDPRVEFAFSSKASIDFFKRCGRVGARDSHTETFLKERGVDAYFSGCMTMTLRSKGVPKTGPVVFCDPLGHNRNWRFYGPDEYLPQLKRSGLPLDGAVAVTHSVTSRMSTEQRFAKAEELLDVYDRASLVVTSRLHCALPCLAMGTPVIFVNDKETDPRFTQLLPILQPISQEDLISGKGKPIQGSIPSELPDEMVKRCAEFFAS